MTSGTGDPAGRASRLAVVRRLEPIYLAVGLVVVLGLITGVPVAVLQSRGGNPWLTGHRGCGG